MAQFSLFAAAFLTVVIGIVHSWLGEVRLIGPLVSAEFRRGILRKSAFARDTLRFAWHITTLAWWGLAAVIAMLALAPLTSDGRTILGIISVTFAATGVVTLVTSRGRHLAWPVFLAIAALTIWPVLL